MGDACFVQFDVHCDGDFRLASLLDTANRQVHADRAHNLVSVLGAWLILMESVQIMYVCNQTVYNQNSNFTEIKAVRASQLIVSDSLFCAVMM